MDQKAGAQISKKAFIQSALILLLLMIIAGVLTRVLPTGLFERQVVDGRTVITPGSYQVVPQPDYPIWRWFVAPVEVLFTPDGQKGSADAVASLVFVDRFGLPMAIRAKMAAPLPRNGRLVVDYAAWGPGNRKGVVAYVKAGRKRMPVDVSFRRAVA